MTLFCWLFPGGMEYSESFYPGGMAVNWVIHPGIIEQELSNIPSTNGQKTLDNPTIRVTDIPGISQTNLVIHSRTKESLQKHTVLAVPGVLAHPIQCQ